MRTAPADVGGQLASLLAYLLNFDCGAAFNLFKQFQILGDFS